MRPRLSVVYELDAKGKAAPKGVEKAKALGDNAFSPVLPVACGLFGGGPILPRPVLPATDVLLHLLVPKFAKIAPVSNVAPLIEGIPLGLASKGSILSVSLGGRVCTT